MLPLSRSPGTWSDAWRRQPAGRAASGAVSRDRQPTRSRPREGLDDDADAVIHAAGADEGYELDLVLILQDGTDQPLTRLNVANQGVEEALIDCRRFAARGLDRQLAGRLLESEPGLLAQPNPAAILECELLKTRPLLVRYSHAR